ncbi:hypothetical protein EWM64_g6028 [Hericium alpestre]|uniref:Uncharacterized protein n=1 Tax=Hericium alpestre TaxID=135208 RepID=A0A4Y9ZT51_9AGAM|nr:hypothetical protein EWM64_g6028 [Hericium alpestre]
MSDSTTITATVAPDAPGTDEDVDVLAAHDIRVLGQSITVTGIVFSIILALVFILAITFPLWLHVRNRRRRARKNLEKSIDLPPTPDRSAFQHPSLKSPKPQQPECCRRARASAPGQPHPEGPGNRPLSPILESQDSYASVALPPVASSGVLSFRFSDNNAAPAPCAPAHCDGIPAERRLLGSPRASYENPVRELSRHALQGSESVRTVDPPFAWCPGPFAPLYPHPPISSSTRSPNEFSTPTSLFDSPQTPDSLSFHRLSLMFTSGSPDSDRAGLLSGRDDAWLPDDAWLYECDSSMQTDSSSSSGSVGLGFTGTSDQLESSFVERGGYWAGDIA